MISKLFFFMELLVYASYFRLQVDLGLLFGDAKLSLCYRRDPGSNPQEDFVPFIRNIHQFS